MERLRKNSRQSSNSQFPSPGWIVRATVAPGPSPFLGPNLHCQNPWANGRWQQAAEADFVQPGDTPEAEILRKIRGSLRFPSLKNKQIIYDRFSVCKRDLLVSYYQNATLFNELYQKLQQPPTIQQVLPINVCWTYICACYLKLKTVKMMRADHLSIR